MASTAGLVLLATRAGNHVVRSVLGSCARSQTDAVQQTNALSTLKPASLYETAATQEVSSDCEIAPIASTAKTPATAIGRGRINQEPSALESQVSSAEELRMGKVIGTLERLLIITLVATNSYAALGFIIGAKGFVRYRKLADETFAEYFLVGTMTSTLVGVLLGLCLQAIW